MGTVLLTGAAGFIGSHLSEALLRRGDTVVAVDNFDPYYDPAIKQANIAALLAHPRFCFEQADIRDAHRMRQLMEQARPRTVVHLAARAGVRPSLQEPVTYDDVNVRGTTTLLEAARASGVSHFVFGSSSSVYGATSVAPFRESDAADRPSSPYAATKRASELACYSYHHVYGLDVTCLRFFTVYGPRQRPEMAIHKFAALMAAGQPVQLYGDAGSRRDYTFVADIVRGITAAVDRPDGYQIYNLGTTATTELRQLVVMLADRLGVTPYVEQLPAQSGDVPLTHADISRASERLGYTPTTSIEEGLDRFVGWFHRAKERPPAPHLRLTDPAEVAV